MWRGLVALACVWPLSAAAHTSPWADQTRLPSRNDGSNQSRRADRQSAATKYQLPPRSTRDGTWSWKAAASTATAGSPPARPLDRPPVRLARSRPRPPRPESGTAFHRPPWAIPGVRPQTHRRRFRPRCCTTRCHAARPLRLGTRFGIAGSPSLARRRSAASRWCPTPARAPDQAWGSSPRAPSCSW